jgi:hypothetical protein
MAGSVAERIDELTDLKTSGVAPLHGVYDAAKLDLLIAGMTTHGWRGAPIVVDGEQGLTGSHRIAAANHLWNRDGIEIPIPQVQVSELCASFDLSWGSVLEEYDGDTYWAAAALRDLLPREVVDYLGYDVDGAP